MEVLEYADDVGPSRAIREGANTHAATHSADPSNGWTGLRVLLLRSGHQARYSVRPITSRMARLLLCIPLAVGTKFSGLRQGLPAQVPVA